MPLQRHFSVHISASLRRCGERILPDQGWLRGCNNRATAHVDRRMNESLLEPHRRRLWALSYQMTGSAADADEVVQESFLRTIQRPPVLPASESLGPWLTKVATNLAIDVLRRRRRSAYVGVWLPSPVESEPDFSATENAGGASDNDPAPRYERRDRVSYALLLALEALTPRQRAVLLLRDVFDYSGREVADLLETTEANVRIVHHRARRALDAFDRQTFTPTPELRQRTQRALESFLSCLASQDRGGLERLLADSVRTATDSAGEYTALRRPLSGRSAVARLYLVAAQHRAESGMSLSIRFANGLPIAVIDLARPVRGQAPRSVVRCEIDAADHIVQLQTILAPNKLTAIRSAL